MTNIHAVVVCVEGTQFEPHAHHVGDGTAVLDAPCFVVAGNSGPPARVGVVAIHQSSRFLREGLTRRSPVLQREKLVEQGVQDLTNSLARLSGLITKDLSIGTLLLTLVQDVSRKVCEFSSNAILNTALVEESCL